MSIVKPKTALISLSDKTDIDIIVKFPVAKDVIDAVVVWIPSHVVPMRKGCQTNSRKSLIR